MKKDSKIRGSYPAKCTAGYDLYVLYTSYVLLGDVKHVSVQIKVLLMYCINPEGLWILGKFWDDLCQTLNL